MTDSERISDWTREGKVATGLTKICVLLIDVQIFCQDKRDRKE